MKIFRPSFRLLEDYQPTEVTLTLPPWETRGPRSSTGTREHSRVLWSGGQAGPVPVLHRDQPPPHRARR